MTVIVYRLVVLLCLAAVSGCSAAAAPCRVTGAAIEIVPVVGGILGTALEACADVID